MSSPRDQLRDFIHQAGELFDIEEFLDPDLEFEVLESEDDYPYQFVELVREETDEVYRFCAFRHPFDLEDVLPDRFVMFRDLEEENDDDYSGSVLLWKNEDDEEFWYIQRVETGEVGLFHSDLSLDDEEEDEDEDEDDEEGEDEDGDEEK